MYTSAFARPKRAENSAAATPALPWVGRQKRRAPQAAPNAIPMAELEEALNPTKVPAFEAVAPKGIGVFDTLKAVAKLVLTDKLINEHSKTRTVAQQEK